MYKLPSKAEKPNNIRIFRKFCFTPRKKVEIKIPNTIVVELCRNDSICTNISYASPLSFCNGLTLYTYVAILLMGCQCMYFTIRVIYLPFTPDLRSEREKMI